MKLQDIRKCSKCGVEKPKSEYHKNNTRASGVQAACKECKKTEKVDPEYAKNSHLMRKYGMTTCDVEAVLAFQDHKCAICGTEEPGGKHDVFHVDHCHTTGEVRGMLCYNCNSMLGLSKDNIETLKESIRYLEAFQD